MSGEGCRFTQTHEWALLTDGIVTVGLTAHALEQLGDIVYLELPSSGASCTKAESFGVIESVKAASDIYAPVDGTITQVNEPLCDDLDLLKTSPYEKAWLIKIEASDESQIASLMDAAAYDEFCKSEVE